MVTSLHHSKMHVTVRCGNISSKTSIAELVSLFTKEPVSIEDIKMRKNEQTQTSLAFVTFMSMKDAKMIVEKYNYTMLHDREMVLTIPTTLPNLPEDANLFVKNIPKSYSTKALYDLFKDFGTVASCKLSIDRDGQSRGYGFVQYEDVESANKAISALQDVKLDGKTLNINKYDKTFKEHRKNDSYLSFTNVFVKNFPSNIDEDTLRSILEKYGPIHSIYMPLNEESKPVGFACVNFENPDDAAIAVDNLHDRHIFSDEDFLEDNITPLPFYIQKAEKRKEREESIRRQLEALSLKGVQSKNNLYVSNIPDTFTMEEIKYIFERFGTITSIKLQKSSPESNKQFGYVCFKTPEEAVAAYEGLDGNLLDNTSKLRVSFYKAKSERKSENITNKNKNSHSDSKDGLSSFGTSKLIQSLVNIVEKTATLYKDEWNVIDANSSVEFSQKMAREFFSVNEKELKQMIGSSNSLQQKIEEILKKKKEKINHVNQ